VISVEHLQLASLLPPRPRAGRWVLTLQNLPSVMAGHALAVAPRRRDRWLLGRERLKAARAERDAAAAADAVITMSEQDAAMLRGAAVIPNGVDVALFRPTPLPRQPRLLATGTLSFLPNIEGLRWFCDNVLPRVQARVPGTTLDIVGRNPVDQVRALTERAGIALHADVPSVVPFVERTRVSIVPVRIGSGTRLKALEAMAAGRPLVGNTVGLAGLGIVDGVHARVTDDAATMADAVVELLTDDGAAQRQVAAARALVEARFSWDAIGRDFVELLRAQVAP
jgi:glycosyltransferase involved in cell wall biosynthesis